MYPENNSSNSQSASLSGMLFNHRRFAPWYDDKADYNTDAKSYYDYLARNNKLMDAIIDLINDLSDEVSKIPDFSNIELEYTVGKKGDFPTLNKAFESIDSLLIKPIKITVRLLSDYIMGEQLILTENDYSYVRIISDNAVVQVSELSSPISKSYTSEGGFTFIPYFYGENTTYPNMKISLQSSLKTENLVAFAMNNSNLVLEPYSGADGFTFIGLFAYNGSTVNASYNTYKNIGNYANIDPNVQYQTYIGDGVRIYTSTLNANNLTITKCGEYGANIAKSSTANLDYLNSTFNGHHGLMATQSSNVSSVYGKITDTIDDCVVAYAGSSIDLRYGDSSRSKNAYGLIATRGGVINFDQGVSNGSLQAGIMANRGSTIDATKATLDGNNKIGIIASNNSKVDFTSGKITNTTGDSIQSTHGGLVQARLATLDVSGRDGILAYAGEVYAHEITIKNSTSRGVECTRGGYVDVAYATIDNSGDDGILAYGTNVNAYNTTISNSKRNAVESTRGGYVNVSYGSIKNANNWGILAYGSKVSAFATTFSGKFSQIAQANYGGTLVAYNAVNNNVTQTGAFNIGAYRGSIIQIEAGTKMTMNVDVNTISTNGVIMQG